MALQRLFGDGSGEVTAKLENMLPGVFFVFFSSIILMAQVKELFFLNKSILVTSTLESCSTTLRQSN